MNLHNIKKNLAALAISDYNLCALLHGSSRTSLFQSHSRSFAFFSFYLYSQGRLECQQIDKEKRMRLKKKELHELPYTEIVSNPGAGIIFEINIYCSQFGA